MASMKDSDTGLWLHNKLGSTDELWAPSSIASLLTASVIDNIRLCFSSLSPPVKLKLLLGMLHLPRRTVDEMKEALSEIIQLATVDSEPWVLMVADILKSFPETGSLNLDLEEQNPNVQDILGELREKVGECEASAMLPLECQYLNKSALTTLVGPLTPPIKHFQLKRKPKSATLRAELLQKSTETAHTPQGDPQGPLPEPHHPQHVQPPQQPHAHRPATHHTAEEGEGSQASGVLRAGDRGRRQRGQETEEDTRNGVCREGLVSAQKLGTLTSESAPPSTSYLPATPSMVPSSSYIPSSEAQPANAGGSGRDAPQSSRQPAEEAGAAPGGTGGASLPGQYKQRTNLSLTRDQMYAAQEMFKTANKVTRPEKALILGFMAGSRENPCPEQGDVIQIKLSEHTEVLPKADGTGSTTMLVDTVFEMNYSTGQWTRLKKYKPIATTS
ncbi:hypothetical protein NHX12_013747 [Muraenolepis orangiensis]|uniref:HDAg domain-containing protein n=1 Tax=Muraenolepis orangiensis TaxID=630683 RepID=A0A9Q0I3Y7_9TELE|nr:hypothetical protein NHX12_013747 [Muraenolepis orangiensis]